jgi:hypothetical protein
MPKQQTILFLLQTDRIGLQSYIPIQKYGNVQSNNLWSSEFVPSQNNPRNSNDGRKFRNISQIKLHTT